MTQQDDFAFRLTSALDRGAKEMDGSTLQQLASIRRRTLSSSNHAHAHGVVALLHRHSFMSALLVLAILFSGWWFAQNQQPSYSAEMDILLLTGDLPPNAYADKTFTQWLEARRTF